MHERRGVGAGGVHVADGGETVDLEVIRDTLRAAITAGCDDLVACSHTPACPLPFEGLGVRDGGSCC
ncbi:hypothetical protein ACFWNN_08445 [Lentzea sp. NPDC058450]|uniref:hypothetical protein n=1 Tax=Lentzea sp. NPDC058450 TaxID=3346505 RepID=UPI003667C29B